MDILTTILSGAQLLEYAYKIIMWVKNRVRWRKISKISREIAFAFHSYSWHYLQQSMPSISTIGTIERPEVSQIMDAWGANNESILLRGEGGTGKSGIAISVAKKLADKGTPVLFIRAVDLPKNLDPAAVIQQRLPFDIAMGEAFSKLAKERTFALIVDQLDTVSGTELCKGLVSLLKSATGIPNIKILAVSRAYEAEHDADISNLHFRAIQSGSLSADDAKGLLALLGLHTPSKNIVKLAENLLQLSLIADVALSQPRNLQNIEQQVDLWENYFHTIHQREGEDVAEFVLNLAHEKTVNGQYSFPVLLPSKKYWRVLLSRGILIEVMGKRLAFKHEQLQEFLCAYAMFPDQPTIQQLLTEFKSPIPRNVISWLHLLYHKNYPDYEPLYIASVLASKSHLAFYTRVTILDNLRNQFDPNLEIAKALSNILKDWSCSKYFFENLENPNWVKPLFDVGYFYDPPEPIEIRPGSFSISPWLGGSYLSKNATSFEQIILAVAQKLKTQNWHAQESILDSLMKITPGVAIQSVPFLDSWLDSPFSRMLSIKLGELADYFVRFGYDDAAIKILEIVITPTKKPNYRDSDNDFDPPLTFRGDDYWVAEFLTKQFSTLVRINPRRVSEAFHDQMTKAIEIVTILKGDDAEKYVGYYWRFDIPFKSSNFGDANVIDVLVDGFRDSLVESCKQLPEECFSILSTYLLSGHIIFNRIALFTLRIHGHQCPQLVQEILGNRDYLENRFFRSEYRGLLRDQFALAPLELRQRIIDWILEGPLDIEERIRLRLQGENRQATDQDKYLVVAEWRLRHLALISSYLSGDAKRIFDELVAKHGNPDIKEKPTISTSGWRGGSSSPIPIDALEKMAFDELIEVMNAHNEPSDSFLDPGESLAEAFQSVVQANPSKYHKFAVRLIDSGLRLVYIYHFLRAVTESMKNNNEKLTDEVMLLCESIVERKEESHTEVSVSHEPNLLACQLEVARLAETALRSDDLYLAGDLLTRIRSILFILAENYDPTRDSEGGSLDPFTQSLNSVRGMSMHGVMHYLMYLDRQRKQLEMHENHKPTIDPIVQQFLQNKLDKTKDPSLAIHSVFGAFLPQLQYLDRKWVGENIERIFPNADEQSKYWQAAWDAYIFNSNVYGDVFELLVPHYQRALRLLSVPPQDKKPIASPSERLAQHIMYVYINGLTDLGHENNLLDLFFANATDEIRSRAVFWLSKVLESRKPSNDDELWIRLWRLWRTRVEFAMRAEQPNNLRAEISDYMRWLVNAPEDLGFLNDILQQSIKFFHNGYSVQLLSSFAAKHCEKYPFEAVSLIFEAIKSATELWWSPEVKDEETILRAAIASENLKAKEIAVDLINYRGDQGEFRWKTLLE